jgi:hypothetical protein
MNTSLKILLVSGHKNLYLWTAPLQEGNFITHFYEMVLHSSEEGQGSQRAVVPVMMMVLHSEHEYTECINVSLCSINETVYVLKDHLFGLVVRVPGR